MPDETRNFEDTPSYSLIREFKQHAVASQMREKFGAHAMGIGRKLEGGEETSNLCFRFYVAKKQTEKALSPEELIPGKMKFFSRQTDSYQEILTDVIETPSARCNQEHPNQRPGRIPGGVKGKVSNNGFGTIGGWVWDNSDDTIVMLSNAHVFHNIIRGREREPIYYSDLEKRIGEVKKVIPLIPESTTTVDCAIGEPDSELYDLRVLEVGPAIYAITDPVLDMPVEKYGQASGHTNGKITDHDWTGDLIDRGKKYQFDDCMRIEPSDSKWSKNGDSGALVFHQEAIFENHGIKPAVGLHFGRQGGCGLSCKISNVFERLDLTTLSAGAFPAFVDALAEAENQGEISAATREHLGTLSALAARKARRINPFLFNKRERGRLRAGNYYRGFARDVAKRLETSDPGHLLTDFVSRERVEILRLLVEDGDIRRATVAALGPLMSGVTTTTDLLDRILTNEDLARLDKLAREMIRRSSERLEAPLAPLMALKARAEGKTLGEILEIR